MTSLICSLSRLWCEHEYIRRYGKGRLWLECLVCGKQTGGIEPESNRTRIREVVIDTSATGRSEGRVRMRSAVAG